MKITVEVTQADIDKAHLAGEYSRGTYNHCPIFHAIQRTKLRSYFVGGTYLWKSWDNNENIPLPADATKFSLKSQHASSNRLWAELKPFTFEIEQ